MKMIQRFVFVNTVTGLNRPNTGKDVKRLCLMWII
jgi:hypothetical protein